MKQKRFPHRPCGRAASSICTMLVSVAAGSLIVACGGGSSSPAPVEISGVVADGPLQGARVCYDLDDNGACDGAEPSAVTDADGKYAFEVDAEAAGKHGVVANVPAEAVDKDTGMPVGAAFTLRSPPAGTAGAHAVFISPLTNQVVEMAARQGISVDEASKVVQEQLGMANSPLANFVASGDAQAASLARTLNAITIEVTKLAIAASLSDAEARSLLSSVTTSELAAIASLAAGVSGTPDVVAASVTQAMLAERNLNEVTVQAQAQVNAMFEAPLQVLPVGPFVSPRRFTYVDADNYSYQLFTGDSSQTDAGGAFVANEVRRNRSGGVDRPFNRNQAYLTVDGWRACEREWQIVTTVAQTSATPQKSLYCGASRSETRIIAKDISGRRMADVVAEMRAFPLADTDGLPTSWGPDPALLGNAVFPSDSFLQVREQLNEVGGTDRYGLTDKPRVRPDFKHAPDFDALRRMSGNLAEASATVNNGNSLFLEDLPVPQPADAALTAVARYRAALSPAGEQVRFYRCSVRASDNSSVNCESLGDGTTTVSTVGDSRVLRFATGYPAAITSALKRQRIFVERGGVVFAGHRDLQRTLYNQRLDTTAWVALRDQLGIPAHEEVSEPIDTFIAGALGRFTYTNSGTYSYRFFRSDGAAAADGTRDLLEQWRIFSGGVMQPWQRSALYWTGSEWYDCPDDPNGQPVLIGTVNDLEHTSHYCKTFIDSDRNRDDVTLDGRLIADVLRDIRWFPTKDGAYDWANFGPNPDATPELTGKLFPAGSRMAYLSSTRQSTPITLFTGTSNQVRVAPTPDTTLPFDQWPFADSLEQVISKYPGDLLGGPLNGNTALFINSWNLPSPPAPEYTTLVTVRVAFDPIGQKARFWVHNRFASTNFSTNYVKLLDTTYSIETLGDARAIRFAALPFDTTDRLGAERVFVERGGTVNYGEKQSIPQGRRAQLRLNETAMQAIKDALGMQ